jgi:predicted dehydrogenase
MGMVGGGNGAFIGEIHRMASRLDGEIDLVAGAFSSDPGNNRLTGESLGLRADRCYSSYDELIETESRLPEDKRVELLSIVTPNHLHFDIASKALEAGLNVLSDKPATHNLADAIALKKCVLQSRCLYGLTHTYQGYPLVWQASHLVDIGHLGDIRKILVEYPQGWLSTDLEADGENKQATWRTDPEKAGLSGCIADIGTHAFNLVEFISGDSISHLCADLATYVDGRRLDDDGAALFRTDKGASGVLMASQVSAGEANGLKIRLYGELGGLEWCQETPNSLTLRSLSSPTSILRAGVDQSALCEEALRRCRTPAGHPEGYIEAFANLYRDFARAIRAKQVHTASGVPGIDQGVRGMQFIDTMVRSTSSKTKWLTLVDGE